MIATSANPAVEPISAGSTGARESLSSSIAPEICRLFGDSRNLPPRLTESETKSLLRRLKGAATEHERIHVRNRLILSNLRLAYSLAYDNRRMARGDNRLPDLCNEAVFGLIDGICRTDTLCPLEFQVFVAKHIKFRMLAFYHESNAVGLPRHTSSDVAKLRRLFDAAEFHGQAISDSAAALALGNKSSIRRVRALKRFINGSVSLNQPDDSKDGDAGSPLTDTLRDDAATCPASECEAKLDGQTVLEKSLSILSDEERDIIERTYGLNGRRVQIAREIALEYGVTRQRVQQRLAGAVTKMRDYAAALK